MTISSGQTILASDLDGIFEADTVGDSMAGVWVDATQFPLGFHIPFTFPGLINTATASRTKAIFVPPCDLLLETVALTGHEVENGKAFSASVTTNFDVAQDFSIAASGTASSAGVTTSATRLLYDNTAGKTGAANIATNRVMRVLLAGSVVTITVSTTSTTACTVSVDLCVREWFLR